MSYTQFIRDYYSSCFGVSVPQSQPPAKTVPTIADPAAPPATEVPPPPRSLWNRVSLYLQMTPAIVVLVASIIGLATVLIYHNPGLSAPFALSIAASVYLIYLSYTARALKSLQETADAHRLLLLEHERVKGEYDGLNKRHGEMNDQHASQLETSRNQIAEREKQIAAGHTQIDALKGTTGKLEMQLKVQAEQYTAAETSFVQQMTAMKSAYEEQQRKLASSQEERDKTQAKCIGDFLILLNAQMETYEKANKEHGDLNSRTDALRTMMTTVFESIRATPDVIQKSTTQLVSLHEKQAELHRQNAALVAQSAAAAEKIAAADATLTAREQTLRTLDDALASRVNTFTDQVAQLGNENQTLTALVSSLRGLANGVKSRPGSRASSGEITFGPATAAAADPRK